MSIKSNRRDNKEIQRKGKVKYLSFEEGVYGILGNDGKHCDPLKLPSEFRVDAFQVRSAAIVTDLVESFHVLGRVVKFVPIERLLGNIRVYHAEFDVPKKRKSRQYDGILCLKTPLEKWSHARFPR